MVLPNQVAVAAQRGNVAAVEAWLNEGGDVNERSIRDDTLLLICVATPAVRTTAHTDLVRLLINRGADVMRLRSLVARGRATPKKWSPRGHDRRAIEFIVKIGDNGIAWKILSFWKET